MFKIDAFGQRTICRPRLMFDGEPGDGGGGGKTPQEQGYDFPADTAVKDMEPAQAAEYWRFHARKHEARAESRKDYDQLKADSEELARVRAEGLSDQEKVLNDAREEARREGENIGADKYRGEAVKARFQFLTGKTDDEVDAVFAHVDATSFLNDSGEIDRESLKTFADTLAPSTDDGKKKDPPKDPVKEALDRQRQAAGGGTSLTERRQATRDRLTKKTT